MRLPLRARHSAGPKPRRSATPGRKVSMRTSVVSTRSSNNATPSGLRRSMPAERLLRSSTPVQAVSPVRTRSMRNTSAPRSASSMPQYGPGPRPTSSTTRTPESGPPRAAMRVRYRRRRNSVTPHGFRDRWAAVTDIAVPYFFARPLASPPWPGVVVVPEGNGISPQLLRVCQHLAHEGYAVAAPDIFWRLGGSDPNRSLRGLADMRMRDMVQDVAGCAEALRDAGATKVGVTGFCLGGRIAYAAATWDGLAIDAAVPFYGANISNKLGTLGCPTLIFFGGNDEYIPSEEINRVVAHHGEDNVIVYPEAGHGFMRDGSESYSAEAASDAWQRMLSFFDGRLR